MTILTETFLRELRASFPAPIIERRRGTPGFPELVVEVPSDWPYIELAPLYDVHLGHRMHDAPLFAKHLRWLEETPYVLSFNGGDLFDNSSKLSVGGGVYEQEEPPEDQVHTAMRLVARVQHKLLLAIPGNHEQRSGIVGLDVAARVAEGLEMPYFPDYAILTLRWHPPGVKPLRYRVLIHHGSGAAVTAGAQRMAARKDISWARPIDIFWTGHLHNPLADVLYQTDVVQETGEIVERNGFVIISPSYLGFFGTYAAQKRYHPGTRGLSVVRLNPDGRMDVSLHARGVRS